jgi:hypothetical protein
VLKCVGIGLKGLSLCRVIQNVDERHLRLSYNRQAFDIEHYYHNGHIAAIIAHPAIQWVVRDDP